MTATSPPERHPASYRDPAGYLFEHDGTLYRQVNPVYRPHYDLLMSSGLYAALVQAGQLIPHEVVPHPRGDEKGYLTLQPERIRFVSYPYEWTFDMLRDAALLTLSVARTALKHGMILKDASAFNVQWHGGRMIFIDTLSFEKWDPSQPWIAYRQFCEHFLAPLALMHYAGVPLQQAMLGYLEGVPVAQAVKLLPWKSRWKVHLYLNLHIHARYAAGNGNEKKKATFTAPKMFNIIKSLGAGVEGLSLHHQGTWSAYYEEAEARGAYIDIKEKIVENWLQQLGTMNTAIDTGANDGRFTALLARKGIFTIAADGDHGAVNALYRRARKNAEQHLVPLLVDFAAPTPAIGVNNTERASLLQRVQADLVLSLAFIHHLAIGKNMSFAAIASLYAALGRILLIEFVSREDEKVVAMLSAKSHQYNDYNEEQFLHSFEAHFTVREKATLSPTRTLFFMQLHHGKA